MIREGAERYLSLVIVSFVVAVVGTRWYLQATGYPQVGGGELHVAHMLWGGLLLVLAAILGLIVVARWVPTTMAILTGAGTGLFIDEVGKFITASDDYFYPLAAPLIYGLLLALVLVFILVRRRGVAVQPDTQAPVRVSSWETAHLPRRRFRRLLIVLLFLAGLSWLSSLLIYLALDPSMIREFIDSIVHVPGDRVERPDEPLFYALEVTVLGAAGAALVVAALAMARGREALGTGAAVVGLVIALTAGALISLYVEQISAISSTILQAALLLAVIHYRHRFASATSDPAAPGAASREAASMAGRPGSR